MFTKRAHLKTLGRPIYEHTVRSSVLLQEFSRPFSVRFCCTWVKTNFIALQSSPCFKIFKSYEKSVKNKLYFSHAKCSLHGGHFARKWRLPFFPWCFGNMQVAYWGLPYHGERDSITVSCISPLDMLGSFLPTLSGKVIPWVWGWVDISI
jgi:hypothetical protein